MRAGQPQLAMNALHIWPRGGFMLIALPNADGSFTATLFLPRSGDPGFDDLKDAASVRAFFAREFPQALALVPDLEEQFLAHPQGILGTVHCPQWRDGEKLVLIGDAAHAIVPFHGQGMNCAFEDCRILDAMLADHPGDAFARFEAARRADTEAIAQMALENYGEMRDAVLDPRFQLQKSLAMALERRHPGRFIPRYAMVMFHDRDPLLRRAAQGADPAGDPGRPGTGGCFRKLRAGLDPGRPARHAAPGAGQPLMRSSVMKLIAKAFLSSAARHSRDTSRHCESGIGGRKVSPSVVVCTRVRWMTSRRGRASA